MILLNPKLDGKVGQYPANRNDRAWISPKPLTYALIRVGLAHLLSRVWGDPGTPGTRPPVGQKHEWVRAPHCVRLEPDK